MTNFDVWEREYKNSKLMTGWKPQKSFLRFLKFVSKEKKEQKKGRVKVLDLGSGNGKNSIYLAKKGFEVYGLEFSKEAIKIAEKKKREDEKEIKLNGGQVFFLNKSIGEKYDFSDEEFDIVLDITSSNSLNEKERNLYIRETSRVLKRGGYFFARGLLKDGDKNAKFLLKNFPISEKDTYKIPNFGLIERVFSKKDLFDFYQEKFKILDFFKEIHYTFYGVKKYKRFFWVLYMKKM